MKKITELKTEKKSDIELLEEIHQEFVRCGKLLDEGYDELLAEYNKFLENKNAVK